MGITYLGPVDGHDIPAMLKALEDAKRVQGAVIVHVLTRKGKGYAPAEKHPARFHGTDPFEIETGMPKKVKNKPGWTDIYSTVMCRLAHEREDLVAVTAAMPDGTGLKRFHNLYPDRFFDVGIAEGHAVTFSAGLAAGGLHPFFAVYSSFLQRAYDELLHDVCLQNLPVTFCIDRAGIVGSDGPTHHGVFDLSFLAQMPNMHIMAPKNKWELADMVNYAADFGGPMAIRYPRGEAYDGLKEFRAPIELGKSEMIYEGSEVCLIAVGSMMDTALQVRERLIKEGHDATLINARFVKPIDENMVDIANRGHKLIVTLEENVLTGGFGERFRQLYDEKTPEDQRIKMINIAIPDEFVEHGAPDILKSGLKMDMASVFARIIEVL